MSEIQAVDGHKMPKKIDPKNVHVKYNENGGIYLCFTNDKGEVIGYKEITTGAIESVFEFVKCKGNKIALGYGEDVYYEMILKAPTMLSENFNNLRMCAPKLKEQYITNRLAYLARTETSLVLKVNRKTKILIHGDGTWEQLV